MTWLQILAQAGIIATFLGVGIAVAPYFNGKYIKEGVRETREILDRMDMSLGETRKILIEETRGIIEILIRMDRRAEERHAEVVGLIE